MSVNLEIRPQQSIIVVYASYYQNNSRLTSAFSPDQYKLLHGCKVPSTPIDPYANRPFGHRSRHKKRLMICLRAAWAEITVGQARRPLRAGRLAAFLHVVDLGKQGLTQNGFGRAGFHVAICNDQQLHRLQASCSARVTGHLPSPLGICPSPPKKTNVDICPLG